MSEERPEDAQRRKIVTGLGWVSGGVTGLMLNSVMFYLWGATYPGQPTSFVAFILGAFGGMALGDRLGEKGFRAMGVTTGVVFALALCLGILLAR